MIAALDLATGTMTYRIRERKRWREFLAFLKLLRARWPKTNFAPNSVIRTWTGYQTNVA
jgi:hypothetical protein